MKVVSARAFALPCKHLKCILGAKKYLFDLDNFALYCVLTTLALELGISRFVSQPLLKAH